MQRWPHFQGSRLEGVHCNAEVASFQGSRLEGVHCNPRGGLISEVQIRGSCKKALLASRRDPKLLGNYWDIQFGTTYLVEMYTGHQTIVDSLVLHRLQVYRSPVA